MSVLWLMVGFLIGLYAQTRFNLWQKVVTLCRRFQAWRRFRNNPPDDRYPPEGQ